jgi:hypothetical protein
LVDKKIIKIRSEINEMEMKGTIQRINEAKSWFFENTDKSLAKQQKIK